MKKAFCVFCLLSSVLRPALAAPAALPPVSDLKAFGAYFDGLATNAVDRATFPKWAAAADAFAKAAQSARKRTAAEKRDLLAEFLANGSTFGLNTGNLEKESAVDLGAAFMEAAVGVLTKRMPQQGLTPEFTLRRDAKLLALQQTAGSFDGKTAAAETLERTLFGMKAEALADPAAARAAQEAVAALEKFRISREDWAGVLTLWDRVAAERAEVYGGAGNAKLVRLGAQAAVAMQIGDSDLFAKTADELDRALPLDASGFAVVRSAINKVGVKSEAACRLLKRFAENRAKLDPATHFDVLLLYYVQLETPAWRVKMRPLEPLRALWEEGCALARDNRRMPFGRLRNLWRDSLKTRHCWAELLALAEEDAAHPKSGLRDKLAVARYAYQAGEYEKFSAAWAAVSADAKLDAQEAFCLAALKAKIESKDLGDFVRRVRELRGDRDVPAWFNALRAACKHFYEMDNGIEMSRYIATLLDLSNEQLWPEERVEYTATFVKEAPESAQAALAADIFSKVKTDDRIGAFNVWNWMDKNADLARLKTNPQPNLHADRPDREGVFCACYDEKGVHVYAKLKDPDAWKARAGLEDPLYCECSVQTGDEDGWHWRVFSALVNDRKADIEWDSPQLGRKMTIDTLKNDVFIGDNVYGVHVFLPWTAAYDRLPADGKGFWRVVLAVRWADKFGSIGGASTHELGRGLKLSFDMSGKDAEAVRLGVLRAAVGEYRKFRKAWENAEFWADPSIGDPAFYEAEVGPWLKELDGVATEASAPDLKPEDVVRLSARLADLSDTRLRLDAKRAAWVREALWKE